MDRVSIALQALQAAGYGRPNPDTVPNYWTRIKWMQDLPHSVGEDTPQRIRAVVVKNGENVSIELTLAGSHLCLKTLCHAKLTMHHIRVEGELLQVAGQVQLNEKILVGMWSDLPRDEEKDRVFKVTVLRVFTGCATCETQVLVLDAMYHPEEDELGTGMDAQISDNEELWGEGVHDVLILCYSDPYLADEGPEDPNL